MRQVRYSRDNENCLDLVLFLNGLPVATVELKTDFTQSVGDAIDQYRFDRHPRPKGQSPEPLLCFPGGALVHFAVSNSEVVMTTRLAGPATRFLPFNQGDHGGSGQSARIPQGHRTSYLWEQVWARDSWLEILGRYLVSQRNDKKQIKRVIFPRYHQLDATRKLQAAVLAEGAGRQIPDPALGRVGQDQLHRLDGALPGRPARRAATTRCSRRVIVVSDRTVIDGQLQEALFDFERTSGVVATIKNEGAGKSGQLAEALDGGKKIIVCTIQTFPFALEAVRELAATQGKRFAVIADEAHSSQTGEAAAKLKQVLSPEELAALEDGGEVGTEDVLAAQMAARAQDDGVTYVAFTATPKAKTLELFGRRPDPDRPAGPGQSARRLPRLFHAPGDRGGLHPRRPEELHALQAGLQTRQRRARSGTRRRSSASAALKGIMRWVRLHPYNISQKVQIVVEHFRENVAPLLDGKAKAMVVLGSRKEAVRWQLAIEPLHQSQGYRIGTSGGLFRRGE